MTGLFGSIDLGRQALDYHLERQNVLASNVANVDTPGFRPLELVRETGEASELTLRMAATDDSHVGGVRHGASERLAVAEEAVVQPGGDENSVSLVRELAKVAANNLRYESAAQVVQMHLGSLRYAASDGVG